MALGTGVFQAALSTALLGEGLVGCSGSPSGRTPAIATVKVTAICGAISLEPCAKGGAERAGIAFGQPGCRLMPRALSLGATRTGTTSGSAQARRLSSESSAPALLTSGAACSALVGALFVTGQTAPASTKLLRRLQAVTGPDGEVVLGLDTTKGLTLHGGHFGEASCATGLGAAILAPLQIGH